MFFAVLLIDIIVKHALPPFPYRYISKPLVVLLLIGFYLYNSNENIQLQKVITLTALSCFLLGDILLIEGAVNIIYLAIGISFFVLGKAFYCYRFSHSNDFNIQRLIPFFLLCFVFMSVLFFLIYDNLGNMFIPILIYFFVAVMMLQLAYLRKDAVNIISYKMVLIGALITMLSDGVTAVKEFYVDIPYQELMIMLFYGISQYLIIVGLVKEKQHLVELSNT